MNRKLILCTLTYEMPLLHIDPWPSQYFCGIRVTETEPNRDRGRRRQIAILLSWFGDATPAERLATRWRWLNLFWPQADIDRLLLTKTDRLSREHLHISFYNAHDFRSTMWLLPLILTGESCVENLWLTARSRVTMQQKHSICQCT